MSTKHHLISAGQQPTAGTSGTHAVVTAHEARFVFLQAYVALGEVLTLAAE